jgi:hypothetical protein
MRGSGSLSLSQQQRVVEGRPETTAPNVRLGYYLGQWGDAVPAASGRTCVPPVGPEGPLGVEWSDDTHIPLPARVFASEVSSRTALGRNWGALGGHFRGEEAPSWLVLVCGDWRKAGKSVGTHWGR